MMHIYIDNVALQITNYNSYHLNKMVTFFLLLIDMNVSNRTVNTTEEKYQCGSHWENSSLSKNKNKKQVKKKGDEQVSEIEEDSVVVASNQHLPSSTKTTNSIKRESKFSLIF